MISPALLFGRCSLGKCSSDGEEEKAAKLKRMVSLLVSGNAIVRDTERDYGNWQILYRHGAAVVKTVKKMHDELRGVDRIAGCFFGNFEGTKVRSLVPIY